jgi:hypothetical protein
MRIIFDCRYTRIGRHDGISRFTAGLVTALAKLHPVTMMINDTRQLELLPDLPWVKGPSPTAITEPLAALYFNKYKPDVVYSPMQTMGPWGRTFGLVTTVHDLIYYSNRTPPRNLAWPVRIIWRAYHLSWGPQRGLLGRADAHVAVSETTKDLMIRNRLTPHPITVIPNAVDEPAATRGAPAHTRDLVYMGSFMPYKNVELLARAMRLLPGYQLHLLSRATNDDRAGSNDWRSPGASFFTGEWTTPSTSGLWPPRSPSSRRHAMRDSGCRSWSRWRSAHRSLSVTSGCSVRLRGMPRSISILILPSRSPALSAVSKTRTSGCDGRPPRWSRRVTSGGTAQPNNYSRCSPGYTPSGSRQNARTRTPAPRLSSNPAL